MRLQPAPAGPEVDAPVDVVISPMRRRDIRAVLRIEEQVYPRPWSMGLFMSELAYGPSRVYVVARVGATIVGYGGLMLVAEDGHITTLAVAPAWHRHKIGTRLLHTLSVAAIARGAEHLTLEVRVGNEPAQRLYQAFGFAPAGIRKGYYVETNEDALIMWANDIDTDEHARRLAALAVGVPGGTAVEDLG
ncbi:MAG TPA: ribosomal protein S18-alanine N-acetyltransferase [Acidimicrobiales bacterium]|nr:ribosomal protein S18-alanine N-acetyltransferase [Acidimicrobiales bacterium]